MSDYYEDSLNGLLEDLPCLIENKFFNELYSNLVISLSVLYSTLDAEYQHYFSSMCSLHEKSEELVGVFLKENGLTEEDLKEVDNFGSKTNSGLRGILAFNRGFSAKHTHLNEEHTELSKFKRKEHSYYIEMAVNTINEKSDELNLQGRALDSKKINLDDPALYR